MVRELIRVTETKANSKACYVAYLKDGMKQDGTPNIVRRYAQKRSDLDKKVKKFLNEAPEYVLKLNQTFGDSLKEWMDMYRKHTVADSSYRRNLSEINNYFLTHKVSKKKLMKVTSDHLQSFLNEIDSDSVTKSLTGVLNKFFTHHVGCKSIKSNPMDIITRRKIIVEKKHVHMHKEDVSKLVDDMDKSDLNFMIGLALSTGMTVSEIPALTFKDVNLLGKYIFVNKGFKRKTPTTKKAEIFNDFDSMYIGPLKRELRVRLIPITDNMVSKFEVHKENMRNKFLEKGLVFNDDCFVFTNEKAEHMGAVKLNEKWKKIQEGYGLSGYTFHDLRKVFATDLVKVISTRQSAAEIMGHTTFHMTNEYYAFSTLDEKRFGLNAMEANRRSS